MNSKQDNRVKNIWLIVTVLLGALLTSQCSNQPKPPIVEVSTPVVSDLNINHTSNEMLPGEEVEIWVNVTVVDPSITISYTWSTEGGEIVKGQGTESIIYQAPDTPGDCRVILKVESGDWETQKSMRVIVPTPTSNSTSTDMPTPTSSPTPTKTPDKVILSTDKIEVLMDDSLLDLDNLPRLISGKMVVLEIFAVDSNGKRYASDDLVCKWSVTPIDADDQDITTDLCKTFYTPSWEYPGQTVAVEVQGLEQQFESSYSISLNFDITP
jgi:hypothetical protein